MSMQTAYPAWQHNGANAPVGRALYHASSPVHGSIADACDVRPSPLICCIKHTLRGLFLGAGAADRAAAGLPEEA